MSAKRYFIGIDEAGRGPLAGPVSVGAVLASARFLGLPFFSKIRDSKQLSAQKRRVIFDELQNAQKRGELFFAVTLIGARTIDARGINYAINKAIKQSLIKLPEHSAASLVLLDGGLKAPLHYKYQKTIIRGDEKEMLIALASIVAKVTRDNKMERLSRIHPQYQFEEHKGYGTDLHRKNIKKFGASPIHRKTFLKNII
jgi:ribonuclease HII